jgi:hypothetical protein
MALATGVALAGIAGLVATHDETTVSSAYIAFFSALALVGMARNYLSDRDPDRPTAGRGQARRRSRPRASAPPF